MHSHAAESDQSGLTSIINPNFSEEDLYYLNGLSKQVEVTYRDLETVMGKKSNIVYCAMKLHLKKKPGVEPSNVTSGGSSVSSSQYSQSSIAYPVYLIITQCKYYFTNFLLDSVAVVRELSRRRSSNMNKSVESSMSQADDWDQNDFDELHPTSKDRGSTPGKNKGNASSVALIESRFLMYDLIKITSRKSSSKIITFYFRVPLHTEYNS